MKTACGLWGRRLPIGREQRTNFFIGWRAQMIFVVASNRILCNAWWESENKKGKTNGPCVIVPQQHSSTFDQCVYFFDRKMKFAILTLLNSVNCSLRFMRLSHSNDVKVLNYNKRILNFNCTPSIKRIPLRERERDLCSWSAPFVYRTAPHRAMNKYENVEYVCAVLYSHVVIVDSIYAYGMTSMCVLPHRIVHDFNVNVIFASYCAIYAWSKVRWNALGLPLRHKSLLNFFFEKKNLHHFRVFFVLFRFILFPFLHVLFFLIDFYWFHYQICVCVCDFRIFFSFLTVAFFHKT